VTALPLCRLLGMSCLWPTCRDECSFCVCAVRDLAAHRSEDVPQGDCHGRYDAMTLLEPLFSHSAGRGLRIERPQEGACPVIKAACPSRPHRADPDCRGRRAAR
jgi:hypothetical protein